MASISRVKRRAGNAWRAQVRKADGTSATRTFPSQREAKQWVTFTENDIAKGKSVSATGNGAARFGDLLDSYVESQDEMQRKMGRSKRSGLALLRRKLGAVKLAEMSVGRTYAVFVADWAKDGAGQATIFQDLSYLRTVLAGGATLLGLDASQQLATLKGTRKMLTDAGRISRPRERNRRPTKGELVKLMAYWDARTRQAIPMSSLVGFAICSAMRLSEITALRWEGLDQKLRTILIRDRK